MRKILSVFCAFVFLCTSCKTQKISVTGKLFEQPFSTQVDNSFAATMLMNPQDSNVVNFHAQYRNAELNNAMFEEITKKYSIDVSTLFLLEQLYQQPCNKQAQNDYLSNMADLSGVLFNYNLDFLKDYYIVFIPGFRYNSNVGNFAAQREMFDSAKISHEMILTDELGQINDNASIVAERLREINQEHRNVILISVSKGGTETAIALSNLLKSEELSSVMAWINVCGILKGTPVADYWATPFRKMWLSIGLFFAGKSNIDAGKIMRDMSYERLKGNVYKIPKNIYTVSFLGTSIGHNKKNPIMLAPNDGFAPLLDEIIDNSVVIVEVETNHRLTGLNTNTCMIAILQHIIAHQKSKVNKRFCH
jgi:hypothetical protein